MKSLFQTLFLGLMVVFLGSCSQEENTELNEMKGDLVVLKVVIDGIEEKKPSASTTKSSVTDTLIGVTELSNGLALETRLMAAEPEAQTKFGGGNNLDPSSKILAVVYKPDGTPYKYQYLSTNNAEILLPQGESFKIVFYSYNTGDNPVIQLASGSSVPDGNGGFLLSGATFSNNIESNNKNVLFARIENTGVISPMTKLPNILFTPLFSRMQWELYTDGSVGFTVSDAKINGTYAQANVKMNNLWNVANLQAMWDGVGTANTAVGLDFSSASETRKKSTQKIFIADESQPTTISGRVMLTQSNDISYSIGKLERGVSYKVMSKLVSQTQKYSVTFGAESGGTVSPNGLQEGVAGETVESTATAATGSRFDGWYEGSTRITSTTGDVIVTGNNLSVKLTSATNAHSYVAKFVVEGIGETGVGAPRIYVEGAGGNARMLLTQNPQNPGVFFQYGSIRAWSYSGAPTLVWNGSNITSGWSSSWVGDPNQTLSNLKAGKGDPCKLVGYTQDYVKSELAAGRAVDNGTWRLPTNGENRSFGSKVSKWTMLGGATGRYFGDGVTSNGTGGQFLPASGYRSSTIGSVSYQGTGGAYWSSTTDSSSGGYYLSFDRNSVFPEDYYYQADGRSVRCVRQ